MAEFTWTTDIPGGPLKNHALSNMLRQEALEDTQFMPFVSPEPNYGTGRGETVTITRIQNITEPTSSVLTEGVRISEDAWSLTTKAITVEEIGRAVPFTDLAKQLTFFDIQSEIQKNLSRQLSLVMDTLAAAAFNRSKVCYIPTGLTSAVTDTDGTPSTAATENMNVYHAEEIFDLLYGTYHTPTIEGGNYVGIFNNLGIRGLKRDADWEEWHKYTDPQAKFNGEVGRIEGIRFIPTNHAKALDKVGTGSVLGAGVVFGDDAVAMAEALTPELRVEMNVGQDFGRSHAAAWYGILRMEPIWDTANAGEVRTIRVTSS